MVRTSQRSTTSKPKQQKAQQPKKQKQDADFDTPWKETIEYWFRAEIPAEK